MSQTVFSQFCCLAEGNAGVFPPFLNWMLLHSLLCVHRQETPMNFVDPKEYNYPGLVRKNRYKTILPSEYLTVTKKPCCIQFTFSSTIQIMYVIVICLSCLFLFLLIILYCPLTDTHSRVILKSQGEDDFLTTYINANYLKVSENISSITA